MSAGGGENVSPRSTNGGERGGGDARAKPRDDAFPDPPAEFCAVLGADGAAGDAGQPEPSPALAALPGAAGLNGR